ncbi:MAG: nucleoid-structuring protein H-NS [Cyclobacteriaceae bacterium]|nr:nucleoid-structuring protein H-NS [Cyclobacteriaceae bacterium]MDH5249757.1 nucleoid-structuring protein H-NS [Cyclobacteriaceae bacterium]
MTKKMINLFRESPRVITMAIIVVMMAVGTGCKSKKKAMEAADAEARKAKMEQEAALKKQQQQQQEEELRKREAEERARREAEAKKSEPYSKLEQYFSAIGNASSVSAANSSISEALTLFTSPETPVLIVISESGGQKDYDRPTTIRDYLNYLKDQKKRADKIGNLQFDSSGKITEVELVKQK